MDWLSSQATLNSCWRSAPLKPLPVRIRMQLMASTNPRLSFVRNFELSTAPVGAQSGDHLLGQEAWPSRAAACSRHLAGSPPPRKLAGTRLAAFGGRFKAYSRRLGSLSWVGSATSAALPLVAVLPNRSDARPPHAPGAHPGGQRRELPAQGRQSTAQTQVRVIRSGSRVLLNYLAFGPAIPSSFAL